MDLRTFEALLTPDGQALLAEAVEMAPTTETLLVSFRRLGKLGESSELVRAALETALLRQKARAKFSRADAMYFVREALEQSTAEAVARHRARRFAGFGVIGDLCCGIGGDAIALAGVGRVVAVDLDPLRLAMAGQNLLAHDRRDRVELRQADLRRDPPPEADALFFDPSRRPAGRRTISVRDYEPPLELVHPWLARTPAIAAKIAPAVPWTELAAFDAEAEFVSLHGELKECVLWFGPLRTVGRRATLLPAGDTLAAEAPALAAPPGPPLTYLYDPDPAVVRAGLVSDLGLQLDARPIDAGIAFLTGQKFLPTPFATAYRVEEAMPFNLKRLRARLRELRVGRVTVLKRGSAVDVVQLQWQLRLGGSEMRVLVLTKVEGRPFVLIGRREDCRTGLDTNPPAGDNPTV
jgi:hypothetical protein